MTPAVKQLIETFKCLPGIGVKSAQRMAFHILSGRRQQGLALSQALVEAIENVRQCTQCQSFTEDELCEICSNPKRDTSKLCIVQNTSDVLAFEQTSQYQGLYFVLHGVLSPIDGITPQKLGLDNLTRHLKNEQIQEVIIATYATAEGEATAHYIAQTAKNCSDAECSRLAYGIPHGGEFEFLDATTLSQALTGRRTLSLEPDFKD